MDSFFFIGSGYTYLTVMRVGALAQQAGVALVWRPFSLRAIMTEQSNFPRNNPVKLKYIWRDIERRAARHGIGLKPGLPYPVDPDLLANRVAVLAALEGWCEEYVVATYKAWCLQHEAPGDPAKLLGKLGIFGAPTFPVGEEIFWGDDRLEDAIQMARGR